MTHQRIVNEPVAATSERTDSLFLMLCVVALLASLLWAATGRIEIVSVAVGEVTPAGQVKKIQHLEGGIIDQILVKEGQQVAEGSELVILESTRNHAEVDELKIRLVSLAIQIQRLKAEADNAEQLAATDDLSVTAELFEQEKALFDARRSRIETEVQLQKKIIIQRQQEIEEVKARLNGSEEVLGHIREQIGISEKLLARDLSNRMTHVDLLRSAASLRGTIAEDGYALQRLSSAIEETRTRILSIHKGFHEEAVQTLGEATRNRAELEQRLTRFQDSLRRAVLRAPVDGVVKNLYASGSGEVIKPGDTVLDLVPLDDRLIIEARLPTGDIGFVQRGQPVTIRLASADAQRLGELKGEVERIAPDTVVTREGQAYYRIRIAAEHPWFEQNQKRYQLYPGMQVTCGIITGERTILQYLIDPFTNTAQNAMRER